MRQGRTDRRQRGFTLVEVSVAMGILAMVMLSLASIASISARGGRFSRQRTNATYLATQMLEFLCSSNIDDAALVSSFNGDDTRDESTFGEGDRTALWGESIREGLHDTAYGTIRMERVDAAADRITDKYRITVEVTWFDRDQQRQVRITGVR